MERPDMPRGDGSRQGSSAVCWGQRLATAARVTARSAIRDRSGLQDAVTGAVQERLDSLAPARTLRVRVHLAGRKD